MPLFLIRRLQTTAVTADGKSLENDFIRVEFDEHMHIVSVYDKAEKRELIPAGEKANVLEVYEDYPRSYDAWEITEYYKQKKWFIDDGFIGRDRENSRQVRCEDHKKLPQFGAFAVYLPYAGKQAHRL